MDLKILELFSTLTRIQNQVEQESHSICSISDIGNLVESPGWFPSFLTRHFQPVCSIIAFCLFWCITILFDFQLACNHSVSCMSMSHNPLVVVKDYIHLTLSELGTACPFDTLKSMSLNTLIYIIILCPWALWRKTGFQFR